MPIDFDRLKKKYQSFSQNERKANYSWKPTDEPQDIRIVPYKFDPGNPFIELYFHYSIANFPILSPVSFGKRDPFSELADELRATGDREAWQISKSITPKLRTFAPIVVRGKEREGIKFWGFGKKVYESLVKYMLDDKWGDITDPANGRDITVESHKQPGQSFPVTDFRISPAQSPLTDNDEILQIIFNSQRDITELYELKTYEELVDLKEKWYAGQLEESSEAESTDSTAAQVESDSISESNEASSAPQGEALGTKDLNKAFDDLFKQTASSQ